MSYTDLGLITQTTSERFDDLYSRCDEMKDKSKSLSSAKAEEVLRNIKEDLQKLEAHGDLGLLERYKMSLVPNLESMYRDLKYWSP